MEKTTIKIDLTKLDKSRIVERKYTNKEGVEVTAKEYSMDVIPLREKELLTEGDTWKMYKNSFVTDTPTKDERKSQKKMNTLGNGIVFGDKYVLNITVKNMVK